MLVRSLSHLWIWAPGNEITQSDPLGKSTNCVDISDTLVCPAAVQVPFFGVYGFISTIIIVILIYYILSLIKKRKTAIEKLKKKKRINKEDLDKLF